MTVDVFVKAIDEEFLEDIDEIKEDTMVEIFIVHPQDEASLNQVKTSAQGINGLYYCAPLSLKEHCDAKCLAYEVDDLSLLNDQIEKPLYIDASLLDADLSKTLIEQGHKGIILNATNLYDELNDFFVAIGPANIDAFDIAVLANASMDKIVLQSSYPEHSFEAIFSTVKQISSVLFRPEESIIARATLHSLSLFGLK